MALACLSPWPISAPCLIFFKRISCTFSLSYSSLETIGGLTNRDYYTLCLGQLSTPLGESLLQYPGLLIVMTRIVLAIEAIGALLLIAPIWTTRLRLAGIHLLGALHVGFGVFMANLGLFPYIDGLVLIALIPPVFWDRLAPGLSSLSRRSRHYASRR